MGNITTLGVLIVLLVVLSTVEMKAATKNHEYCKELSRAVEDFCSYEAPKKYCPRMCKAGKTLKLKCGKNLHTPKKQGLIADAVEFAIDMAAKFAAAAHTGKDFLHLVVNAVTGKKEKKAGKRTSGSKAGSKRILNGEKADQGEWPWHLTLRNYPNKTSKGARWCEATILSENFVLTTQHCFGDWIEGIVGHKNFTKAKQFKVIAGDYDTTKKEEFESEIQVEELYHNPSYESLVVNKSDNNGVWAVDKHDITVMKLKTPIKLEDKNKEQVCIPKSSAHNQWKDATCYSYGYGFTHEGLLADYLQEVELPLVPLDKCNAPQAYNNTVTDVNLCAGFYKRGKSVCNFDSGASLVCNKNGDDAQWFQLGMVSTGKLWVTDFSQLFAGKPQTNMPCSKHDGDYGLFTDVVKNMEWVLTTILEL